MIPLVSQVYHLGMGYVGTLPDVCCSKSSGIRETNSLQPSHGPVAQLSCEQVVYKATGCCRISTSYVETKWKEFHIRIVVRSNLMAITSANHFLRTH